SEVSPAVTTALATTIVSFIPVFALEAAEGKLFHPLAITKTFAMFASFLLGIFALPSLAQLIFSFRVKTIRVRKLWNFLLIGVGAVGLLWSSSWIMLTIIAFGINDLLANRWPESRKSFPKKINVAIALLIAIYYLSIEWLPLGAHNSALVNFLFVAAIVGIILAVLMLMVRFYEPIIRWCLDNKGKFLLIPVFTILLGLLIWQGTHRVFGFVPRLMDLLGWKSFSTTKVWVYANHVFPGMGKEFMPSLNEGSFLLMPTSMPHAGIEKSMEYVRLLDKQLAAIPEVELAVGKWGRVNSALDPAPAQMFENIVNYRPEYILDEKGHRMRFKVDRQGRYLLKSGRVYDPTNEGFKIFPKDSLISDPQGEYFRQWRPEIKKPDDIWNEIVKVTQLPGLTSAPRLQPIETRLVMLSTGMRASMGVKVFGSNLDSIDKAGLHIEQVLKTVPSVNPSSVFYDRAVGAPYLEIKLNREAMARYGLSIAQVQEVLQVAIGGMTLTTTVEGRERYAVRLRYARELRDNPDDIKRILIPTYNGIQIPLSDIADIEYSKGPQMIRSENAFLVGYIIFDKLPGKAEVDVVEEANRIIREKIDRGNINLPSGVSFRFTGNYEQQERATKRLAIIIPMSLLVIFLLLYFRFRSITASAIHFSGVFVAFAGGFIMLWLYGQEWFLNFSIAGVNMRDLFQMHVINLSVAVWVGFIALFGIATNDGVIMGTYIHRVFEDKRPQTVDEVRDAVVEAGKKRVRPAMMTTAVAVIALLPVLTSTGKGSEIMVPMAIPTFGGMLIQVMTIFVVPVFQAIWRENVIRRQNKLKPFDYE
ncbi:MAG: efflux RND transporter permease subunit, partial [Bacteroidales bacterium]|nr:efflux RND transporter permease subunit [Bacteroidales bacterium]